MSTDDIRDLNVQGVTDAGRCPIDGAPLPVMEPPGQRPIDLRARRRHHTRWPGGVRGDLGRDHVQPEGGAGVTALKVFAALTATLAATFAGTYLAARWLLRGLPRTCMSRCGQGSPTSSGTRSLKQ